MQVLAQQPGAIQADIQPPSFPTLFPTPTNNNGFEEFVRAADLVQNIGDIDETDNPGATLAQKRRVLGKSECKRALELLREGLAKPAIAPKRPTNESDRLPIGSFMRLGHLLAIEQYVDYADGRVDSAIDSLHAGLAFGYRIQCSSVVSGLSGIVVDTVLLNESAAHTDQLSIFDCDNLVRIVKDLLAADCPGISLVEKEKTSRIDRLDSMKMDGGSLLALVAATSNLKDGELTASLVSLKNQLATQPGNVNSVISDAEARIAEQFDSAAQEMRLPASQRKPLGADSSNSPGNVIARSLTWSLPRLVDRYTGDQARIRLLGVHAVIKRYQWDHNALPGSLGDLHEDDLVTDPFTGSRLVYKKQGDRYTLTSAGPTASDGSGQRDPVELR